MRLTHLAEVALYLAKVGLNMGPSASAKLGDARSLCPPSVGASARISLAAALLSTGRSAAQATVLSRDDEVARLDTIQQALRLHAHVAAVPQNVVLGPVADSIRLLP
jgi:hypothetical protein